ncbi:MAG: hypothetical protein NZ898_05120 [Myxococcota bacterium]|nr:hypothetical protein [Myxococcota bacterium]MDW8362314.1 hypothetical protein [Myxococcales bacterium]
MGPALAAIALLVASSKGHAQAHEPAEGLGAPRCTGRCPAPHEIVAAADARTSAAPMQGPGFARFEVRLDDGSMLDASTAARLLLVQNELSALAAHHEGWRGALVPLLLGTGMGVVAATATDEAARPYLWTWTGASLARALLAVWPGPDPRATRRRFAAMPMREPYDARARLRFAERSLALLAEHARLVRLVDAGLQLGVAALVVPLYLGSNERETSPEGALALVGAAVSLLGALAGFLQPSEAESRWHAYRGARERAPREWPGHVSTLATGGSAASDEPSRRPTEPSDHECRHTPAADRESRGDVEREVNPEQCRSP